MPAASSTRKLADRRTIVVWVCLLVSMSSVAGLLMALEPTPIPSADGVAMPLLVVDQGGDAFDAVFRTNPEPQADRWQAIVIHHSGQPYGNNETIADLHQSLGYGGLGYHFVIGNGSGTADGEVQTGYRWARQVNGVHAGGPDGEWYNRFAIGICLVGNGDRAAPTDSQMRQLARLVHALQRRLDIPAERVVLHSNIAETTSPGRFFPAARFRQQLLTID